MEGDLLRYWSIDLPRDLGTKRLTWRRLRLLIDQLPRDSATVRKLNPDAEWTLNAHLLALLVDVANLANWQRMGDKNAERPKPIERPGNRPARSRLSVEERIAQLKAMESRR